ncbi:hypothetical protein SAMN02799631_05408 [Methylobacterium sp. 174MFSha1.1]|nr:hypothetical protein SAMN02799631_05408 [Methylobacterium sp. 174MFSha1.1]
MSFRGRAAEPGIQNRRWTKKDQAAPGFVLHHLSVWIPGSAFAAPE